MGLALLAGEARAASAVVGLRVGGQVNPLGFDDPHPALSWRMESNERGAAQSAYQVLVATTPEQLALDRGDLWDSGRVTSAESVRVGYAGAALHSGQTVFWKVRVWNESARALPWSAPASWSVGVLERGDWSAGARWITDAGLMKWWRPRLGYRSRPAHDALTPKWIQFDLGASLPIEMVRLRALTHTVDERLGFPRRWRLEVAERADFGDARVVVEPAGSDANPWVGIIELPLADVTARYVRFTATKLRELHGEACLALSQVEVTSGGKNLALQAILTASDSIESAEWGLAAINDGLGVPGTNPQANSTLRLRRDFKVGPGLKRAHLRISGLGQYTLAVNGAPVDADRLFLPGWTEYEKTQLYETHDVTARLREGLNALGVTLAGGFYNAQPGFKRYLKLSTAYRPLRVWGELQLDYADGRTEIVPTDGSWKVAPGPADFVHVYGGEDFDARRDVAGWAAPGFAGSGWASAVEIPPSAGWLRGAAWSSPAFKTHENLEAVNVRELKPGVSVYDFGQNVSMMPRLRVRGSAGAMVRMIPAELLRDDGTVNRGSAGGGNAWWQYTLRGDPAGEVWTPSFFYQGARYLQVEVTGDAKIGQLESLVVHSDSPPAGTFACSNELFNRIHTLVRWAQRSNLAHVLTDCPHREKLGWLEQYHLNGPSLRYEWDLTRLFAKTFNDMADAQRENGHIPSIAPEYVVFDGGFVDSPEWGSALILAGWQHYLFTGDDAPLRRHYDAMQRYLAYLGSRASGHIVDHGLGDWYDVGPKPPGVAQLTPIALTATAIYQEDAAALARIAKVLGRADDANRFEALAGEIASAFNAKFFNPGTGAYAAGSQTAQAMPLALGLVPAEKRASVTAALLSDIAAHGNSVTAGDVGYRYLLRALADTGHSDVIFAMNNQSERPGYGLQLARGATSLTEAWDANPRNSQNHFMLGQINEWFYQDLAGLGVDPAAPGFKNVIIRPQPTGDIAWAEASHESPYGPVRIRWERAEGHFKLDVTVPPNSTATIFMPAGRTGDVTEGGRPATKTAGVKHLRREGDREVYQVGSGRYAFESRQ